VVIKKKQSTSLGLDIRIIEDEGVLISKILDSGAAQKSGKLKPGDFIIKINGEDIKAWDTQETIEKLRGLHGEIVFTISRS